jgi:hypothetical protein
MAGLQGQYVDVPLAPMNQQATKTGGPVGRLRRLLNAVVKKITRGDQPGLRVEKRDGFAALPTGVRDPSTGAVSSKTLASPSLLGTYGAQLIAIFLAAPFVLSEAAGCWESPTYGLPTRVLRERGVYNGSTVLNTPDSARLGTRTMTAWYDASAGPTIMVKDDDGTVILQPKIVQGFGPPKVTSDGARFWVSVWTSFPSNGIIVGAYDGAGQTLGAGLIGASASPMIYFDVTKNTNAADSIVVLQKDPASAGFQFTTATWNGAAVVLVSSVAAGVFNSTGRVAFLTNDRNDHKYHVIIIDGAGPFTVRVAPINDSSLSVAAGPFTVLSPSALPVDVAGHVQPTGNADYVIAVTFLDATPTPQFNQTLVYSVTAAGVSTAVRTQRSLSLASRAFRMVAGGGYYAVAYFRSNPAGVTAIAQSTYFLLDLSAPYKPCGRWEFGLAYNDWLTTAVTTYYMALSSPQLAADGGIHVALTYRSSSTIAITLVGDVFEPIKTLVDTVGIKDYQLGPDGGQCVEHSGALFLPGAQAHNYTGATFAEDGIGLVPEVISLVNGGAGALTGTFEYVVVDEWTDNNGQRVRSPSGVPFSITLAAAQATLTGYHNHVTSKTNMVHSVYRTIIKGGVQTTEHYKVSGSLQGGAYLGQVVTNDDNASTWTFSDNMADAVAGNNEVLYTDKGLLDHFPAPPFSVGVAAFDRIFLAGPDNAVWFSGPKTEGDSFWFHPTFRIPLPTRENVKAIRQLDDFILVMCEGSSVFAIPNGPFPGATGEGSIPSARALPFTNGCTGWAETTSDGVMYSSTQGGIWLITRDLKNIYIGAAVEDEKAANETFVGVATDDKQRTAFLTSGENMLVYDQVTGVWSVWTAASGPLTVHKGRFVYLDGSPSTPFRQVLGTYVDGAAPIVTTVTVAPMHLAGVRRAKRLWQTQMVGERLGDHDMSVTASVNDESSVTQSATWTPSPTGPYVYELPANARTELCASVSYTFVDSFPRGASQGFALEMLSMYVGLEQRPLGLPATSRIGST